jgi:hypothetical protein
MGLHWTGTTMSQFSHGIHSRESGLWEKKGPAQTLFFLQWSVNLGTQCLPPWAAFPPYQDLSSLSCQGSPCVNVTFWDISSLCGRGGGETGSHYVAQAVLELPYLLP